MLGVGLIRDRKGVHALDLPVPEIREPDQVLVKVKEVGLDGTDFNILKYNLQDMAEGQDHMVLGHEMVGMVEEVGGGVTSLVPGDIVTMTVRRGCGICQPCLHNQSDMCMTGLYTERGIHKLGGVLTEYLVDKEQYIVKVPPEIRRQAVLTEPLSIAEKGIEQIRIIQSRMPWTCEHPEHGFLEKDWGGCKLALVVGAGPLGILATSLLRLAEVNTFISDIVDEDHPKVELAKQMGASYLDARERTPDDLVKVCMEGGNLDIIFEASGAAATAVELIKYMARSSIYVMTGIPRGDLDIEVDAAQMVRRMVRFNQVLVGSVNSNRSHFEMALAHIPEIQSRFGGVLDKLFTKRASLRDFGDAFDTGYEGHIKILLEVDPWD